MTVRLEKTITREIELWRSGMWASRPIVEISPAGIAFRKKGSRTRIDLSWADAFKCAERLAGERAHQEKLRTAAIRRSSR